MASTLSLQILNETMDRYNASLHSEDTPEDIFKDLRNAERSLQARSKAITADWAHVEAVLFQSNLCLQGLVIKAENHAGVCMDIVSNLTNIQTRFTENIRSFSSQLTDFETRTAKSQALNQYLYYVNAKDWRKTVEFADRFQEGMASHQKKAQTDLSQMMDKYTRSQVGRLTRMS